MSLAWGCDAVLAPGKVSSLGRLETKRLPSHRAQQGDSRPKDRCLLNLKLDNEFFYISVDFETDAA